MKNIFLILITLLISCKLFAQPFRYRETVFAKADTLKNIEYSKAPWLNNIISVLAEYNIHDGESETEERPLFMDIFMPHGDTLKKRPAIIFAHSGAFMLGSRKNDDMIALCDSFARRGYVTATIDYRLGMGAYVSRFLGVIINLKVTEYNVNRAAYRALQDSRAAIRFLKYNAANFGIDTTKIYFAGSSAGAFIALANIYLDKKEEMPADISGNPQLGGLDSFGVQGFGAKADAAISLWGAISNTNIIENDTTPLFLVHGKADDIVPFRKGIPLDGMIEPNPLYSLTMPETYGSFCVDTALTNRNIPHKTYFVDDKKHEFYGVVTGNFHEEGPNEYWDTIQWKISDFLFDIFRPEVDFDYQTDELTVYCNSEYSPSETYKWEFENGDILTGNNILYTFAEQGTYRIKLTTCNSNLACDTITKSVTTGKAVSVNTGYLSSVKVYPNPCVNKINIEGLTTNFEVKVYDMEGRIRIKEQNTGEIKTDNLTQGFYILSIKTDRTMFCKKILKQVK